MKQSCAGLRFVICLTVVFLVAGGAAALEPTEIPIDVLVYYHGPSGPGGAVIPTIVGIGPNPAGRIRVGFFEEIAMGTGSMWRTAGWMAAVVGAYTLRKDLADFTVFFDVGGLIDGPSAGALMTVAFLAGAQGHSIFPHATMTGTVNPDGTVGPVGGIRHKISGAAALGKTLVLIPIGQRFEPDEAGTLVDLVDHGQEVGVEVREVGDIFQAYRLLTGQVLPEIAAEPGFPELIPDDFAMVRGFYEQWHQRYQDTEQKFASMSQPVPEAVRQEANAAHNAFRQGLVSLAYERMVSAYFSARIEYVSIKLTDQLLHSDWPTSESLVASSAAVFHRLDALLAVLQSQTVTHMGHVSGLLAGYAYASQALGCCLLAEDYISQYRNLLPLVQAVGTPTLGVQFDRSFQWPGALVTDVEPAGAAFAGGVRRGDVIQQVNYQTVANADHLLSLVSAEAPGPVYLLVARAPEYVYQEWLLIDLSVNDMDEYVELAAQRLAETHVFLELAEVMLVLAEDYLQIRSDHSPLPAPDPQVIKNLGTFLRAGAVTGLEYFDATILSQAAKEFGVHPDHFRAQFMGVDYAYALTYANYVAGRTVGQLSPYALLGTSASLFYDTGYLIAKYYGLQAETDEFGTIVRIRNERALMNMLDHGRQRALTAITEARQAGIEPTISIMAVETAQYMREQDLDSRLAALQLYWNASFLAQTLTMLADHQAALGSTYSAESVVNGAPPSFLTVSSYLSAHDNQLNDDTYYHSYDIVSVSGGEVNLILQSNDFHPYLLVIDDTDALVAEQGPAHDQTGLAVLDFAAARGQRYHVLVNSVHPEEVGAYLLQITGAAVITPEGELVHPQ